MKTAVVTDSTSDIPNELAERYSITVIPNILVMDGQSLEDGKNISREEFYERLPFLKTQPTTASAPAGAFQTIYERLLHQGIEHIISIHPPAQLSGILNAATIAAQNFNGFVKVIDSGYVSLGMGFQAIEAAECALKGLAFDAILERIAAIRARVRVVAMLDTLEFVRRSGRVSWARARLGQIFDFKPLIELREGKIMSLGEARTRRRGIERLKTGLENLGPLQKLAIVHTNAERDAHRFLNNLQIQVGSSPLIVNVTTVIGTHVGPNGLGYIVVCQ